MAGFLGKVFAQVNLFDHGATYSNPKPVPQSKPTTKVNIQQLQQALRSGQINQQQFINQYNQMPQNQVSHPGIFSQIAHELPHSVPKVLIPIAQSVPRGIVRGDASIAQAVGKYHPAPGGTQIPGWAQPIVGSGKVETYQQQRASDIKKGMNPIKATAVAVGSAASDIPGLGLEGKAAKTSVKTAVNAAKPVSEGIKLAQLKNAIQTDKQLGDLHAAYRRSNSIASDMQQPAAIRSGAANNANALAGQIKQRFDKINQGGFVKVPGAGESLPDNSPPKIPQSKSLSSVPEVSSSANKIDRTQLTGKALDTPTSNLGQATRSIDTTVPRTEQTLPAVPSDTLNTKISSQTSSGLSKADAGSLMQQVDRELPHTSQHIAETVTKPGYDVTKKAAILDYIRTPANVLNKMGIGHVAGDLRTAEHQYRQTLPQEIEKLSNWRKQVGDDPAASQRIFQHLDGNKGVLLNPTETKVAGEMKTELANWANRLNLPKEARLSNYITHIFEDSLLKKEFDPELEKIIDDKTPRSVYDPFTQQRLGAKGYVEDAFRAMEAYVKRGTRKEAFDPALAKLEAASQNLDLQSQKFVKHYADRINMRPTDLDKLIDNQVKQVVGYKLGQRPVTAVSRAVRQATYRATLGMNVGSAVRNLTQGINTFAELGSKWTAVGYSKAVKEIVSHGDELKRTGVMDNSFVEDRVMSSFKKGLQKADSGLFSLFDFAEKMNRGAAYFGAKSKALKDGKSLEEAIKSGVEAARKTQFTFGKVDTPVALQSDIVKTLAQFQSYNVKQGEFIAGLVKNKEFTKLARFAGASAAVYFSVGKALGYNPGDMVPSVGIGQSPAFKVPGDTVKAVKKHDRKSLMKVGSDLGSATIPGFSQAKKTVTGIKAVDRGQVKKGNTTLKVQPTTRNKVKAGLFGPYSLNGKPKPGPVKQQVKDVKTELTPGINQIVTKDNNVGYATLVGKNYHTFSSYKAAKNAQAKNEFKYSDKTETTINRQQYHKSASGAVVKGIKSAPKAKKPPKTVKVKSARVAKVKAGRARKSSSASQIKIGKLPSTKVRVKLHNYKTPKFRVAKFKLPRAHKIKTIKVKG